MTISQNGEYEEFASVVLPAVAPVGFARIVAHSASGSRLRVSRNAGPYNFVVTLPFPLFLFYVGTNTAPAAEQDGTPYNPFATIQQALTAIGPPANIAEQNQWWTIMIAPGDYTEDLTVPAQRQIYMLSQGGIARVGTGAATSLTWVNDGALGFGGDATLVLDFVDLSNNAVLSDNASGAGGVFAVKGAVDIGGIDASGYSTGLAILFAGIATGIGDCGAVSASTSTFIASMRGTFSGLVDVGNIGPVVGCRFSAGMTLDAVPSYPSGLFQCLVSGTFKGPAGSFVADNTTIKQALAGALLFAGGALPGNIASTDPEECEQFTANSVPVAAGDSFLMPYYEDAPASATASDILASCPGQLRGLLVSHGTPTAFTEPITYTVGINGVDTALTVTVNADAASGENLTDSVSFVRTDRISLKASHAAPLTASPTGIIVSYIRS